MSNRKQFLPSLVILEDGSVLVGYRGTKCCCDELIGTWGMCGEHEYESASYLRFVIIAIKIGPKYAHLSSQSQG